MPELRLVDPNGYTVPGTVNSGVPTVNEAKVRDHLLNDVAPVHAAEHAYAGYSPRDYRVQAA